MDTRSRLAACAALMLMSVLPMRADAADAGQRITGPQLVRILQDIGYKAALDKDGDGDPMIRTKMGGLNTYVYFYDCDGGACGSLQFSVGLDLEDGTTLDVLNRFSRDNRYAHVYLDEERDPFMQFDFEVLHAEHAAHVASQVDLWERLLNTFARVTGYRDDGSGETREETSQGAGTFQRM